MDITDSCCQEVDSEISDSLALVRISALALTDNAVFLAADLPIGMITSLVGGPFFLWLLVRTRRRAGGWA